MTGIVPIEDPSDEQKKLEKMAKEF